MSPFWKTLSIASDVFFIVLFSIFMYSLFKHNGTGFDGGVFLWAWGYVSLLTYISIRDTIKL